MISSRLCAHLRLLFGLLVVAGAGGCAYSTPWPSHYYQVQATNPRGEFVAEWVAIGLVRQNERGYRFRAIERRTAPPFAQTIRYPQGRMVEATGPNVRIFRCGEPLWHYEQRHTD